MVHWLNTVAFYFNIVVLLYYSSAEECQDLKASDASWKIDCRDLKLNSTMVERVNDIRTYTEISFENNGIVELKKSRISNSYAQTVEIFNFENNLIKEIEDGCFEEMHSLTNLNLARNQLDTINSNWFTGLDESLETLDLSGNKISKIPDNAFIRLKSLKNLTLDRNPIHAILPGSFSGQHMLETLSIRFGRLERLPQLKLPILKHVDFSGNPVETIQPYTFINALQLTTIVFELMPRLSKIAPNAFAYLTNMQYLQISGSPLLRNLPKLSFEPDFRFRDFSEVNFSYNNLTTIPKDLFNWIAVKKVFLAGNEWNCSCEISWMLDPKFNIVGHPKCTYPANLSQQFIKTLKKNVVNNQCTKLTKRVFSASAWNFTLAVPWQFPMYATASSRVVYTSNEKTSTENTSTENTSTESRRGYFVIIVLPIGILGWCLRNCTQSNESQQRPVTSDQPRALSTFSPYRQLR